MTEPKLVWKDEGPIDTTAPPHDFSSAMGSKDIWEIERVSIFPKPANIVNNTPFNFHVWSCPVKSVSDTYVKEVEAAIKAAPPGAEVSAKALFERKYTGLPSSSGPLLKHGGYSVHDESCVDIYLDNTCTAILLSGQHVFPKHRYTINLPGNTTEEELRSVYAKPALVEPPRPKPLPHAG